jgi:GntP family gluconate:H+ symporter
MTLLADPILIVLIAIIVVVISILWLRLHAFVALILAAFVVALLTPSSLLELYAIQSGMNEEAVAKFISRGIGDRIATAFGNTSTQIGIMIGMAAIIGKTLLDSGGAERIVRSIVKLTGQERAPLAFSSGGFLLGIPVFFDTVFYLMVPLAKAMAARVKKNYLLYILTIAAGASMAHSLVPPTPGPLFLIGEMGIPIHYMMIGGIIVGMFTTGSGYLYALWINKRMEIPLRSSSEISLETLASITEKPLNQLPSLTLSLMPVIVPLILISAKGFLETFDMNVAEGSFGDLSLQLLSFAGEKNFALILGGLLSLYLLYTQKKNDLKELGKAMEHALTSAGVIILITAAGGAFGAMLQQTSVSYRIAELTQGYQMALIPLAFLITVIVRTAQGSATVSMITASGIMSGLAVGVDLNFHILYIGLAIACGSKLITWMNDSGFWIVCKMSDFTEAETLRTFSVMQAIMGITGFIVVYLGALLFPLV